MGTKEPAVEVVFGPNWNGRQLGLCLVSGAVYAAFAVAVPQMAWPIECNGGSFDWHGNVEGPIGSQADAV